MPFSALDGVIYNEYWPDGAGADDLYYPWPNHISNTTIGNVFKVRCVSVSCSTDTQPTAFEKAAPVVPPFCA